VVKFGPSVELCGGCHTSRTGNIGLFKISSEAAIAAGIRRIEAVTGEEAENVVYAMQEVVKTARAMFNNAPGLTDAIRKMIEENEGYKKQIAEVAKEKTLQLKKAMLERAVQVNGHNVIRINESRDLVMLRDAATMLQKEAENLVIAAAFESGGKPQLLLMYSQDLVKAGKNAGADIRDAAKFIQGGGGGQPGLATAGGKDVAGLSAALDKMIEKI
jgi:alanyl-tRNA synthetase